MDSLSSLLELSKVKEWLCSRPDQVFVQRSSRSCPLATYLKETIDSDDVSVGPQFVQMESEQIATPLWIRMFIDRFDNGTVSGIEHVWGTAQNCPACKAVVTGESACRIITDLENIYDLAESSA